MGKIVPPYGEGALGHLILQVLRDAGEDGLTVTDLIQATKDAGRRYPSSGAERSGVTNVIVGGTDNQKKQARAIFQCANPEERFLEQRWALRFDKLDLASLGETPTEDTYVPAKRGGRRKSSDAVPADAEDAYVPAGRGGLRRKSSDADAAEPTRTNSGRPRRQRGRNSSTTTATSSTTSATTAMTARTTAMAAMTARTVRRPTTTPPRTRRRPSSRRSPGADRAGARAISTRTLPFRTTTATIGSRWTFTRR